MGFKSGASGHDDVRAVGKSEPSGMEYSKTTDATNVRSIIIHRLSTAGKATYYMTRATCPRGILRIHLSVCLKYGICSFVVAAGVNVLGREDLPDAVFLRGEDQRTAEALEAMVPNLSRPEVQVYIVR